VFAFVHFNSSLLFPIVAKQYFNLEVFFSDVTKIFIRDIELPAWKLDTYVNFAEMPVWSNYTGFLSILDLDLCAITNNVNIKLNVF